MLRRAVAFLNFPASPAESPRKGAPTATQQQAAAAAQTGSRGGGTAQHNDSNSTLMHSPPSPKAHLDSVTLSASAGTGYAGGAAAGATTVLKDTAIGLNMGRAHHSGTKKSSPVVDMDLISHQISELANRVDTLESSMKTDIRTILEILQHQQQQQQYPGVSRPVARIGHNQQQQTQPQPPPPVVPERQSTNTYQTDSEYSSFDLGLALPTASHGNVGGIALGMATPGGAAMKVMPSQQQQQHNKQQRGGNVQRSISQPECANERNLFT